VQWLGTNYRQPLSQLFILPYLRTRRAGSRFERGLDLVYAAYERLRCLTHRGPPHTCPHPHHPHTLPHTNTTTPTGFPATPYIPHLHCCHLLPAPQRGSPTLAFHLTVLCGLPTHLRACRACHCAPPHTTPRGYHLARTCLPFHMTRGGSLPRHLTLCHAHAIGTWFHARPSHTQRLHTPRLALPPARVPARYHFLVLHHLPSAGRYRSPRCAPYQPWALRCTTCARATHACRPVPHLALLPPPHYTLPHADSTVCRTYMPTHAGSGDSPPLPPAPRWTPATHFTSFPHHVSWFRAHRNSTPARWRAHYLVHAFVSFLGYAQSLPAALDSYMDRTG